MTGSPANKLKTVLINCLIKFSLSSKLQISRVDFNQSETFVRRQVRFAFEEKPCQENFYRDTIAFDLPSRRKREADVLKLLRFE